MLVCSLFLKVAAYAEIFRHIVYHAICLFISGVLWGVKYFTSSREAVSNPDAVESSYAHYSGYTYEIVEDEYGNITVRSTENKAWNEQKSVRRDLVEMQGF